MGNSKKRYLTNKDKGVGGMKKKKRLVVLTFLILMGGGLFIRFKEVQNEARQHLATYDKDLHRITTSYGKLSYIDKGRGEAILSCHGICGGYDQAADTLAGMDSKYRIIAPSRFGYTGSDMPEHATIDSQADALKELLEQMGEKKVYVLATSAGATSAMKFALKYPEHTKGLILYCSGYPGLEPPKKEQTYAGPPAFLCNDLTMWSFSPLFGPIMGMDQETVKLIMPLEGKKEGIVFDAKVTNTVMLNNYKDYDLSKLKVPVLILHAKDDKLADYSIVEQWAKLIPNCTFVPFETGGHLMAGHSKEIEQSLESFINETK